MPTPLNHKVLLRVSISVHLARQWNVTTKEVLEEDNERLILQVGVRMAVVELLLWQSARQMCFLTDGSI